ncbi:lipase secretion chaperone [Shewanella salipaludis]|uniref:Lipase chaperone n=1 Tax=Shewanella salipaludis TaxID=2723052 RepID=A0A972FRR0_9GAMM|nr:lipase secretion chaperone [Shewanella salipaludis]NMH64512.1 lipase chaperone [Shewanella salipaludis]
MKPPKLGLDNKAPAALLTGLGLLLLLWVETGSERLPAPAPALTPASTPALTSGALTPGQGPQAAIVAQVANMTGPAGESLVLEQALRWQFDDIILDYQQTGAALSAQLNRLAEQHRLTPTATTELSELFYRYRDYQLALAELKALGPQPTEAIDITETHDFLEQVYRLQFDYFTQAEIEAFFARDNAYDSQALARVSIRQDSSLTPAQKQTLLAHQISQLDEQDRRVLMPTLEAQQIAAQLRGQETTAAALAPEIQERVTQTRASEQAWHTRVGQYLQLQQELPQAELETYLAAHFSNNEMKRLRVFLAHPELLGHTSGLNKEKSANMQR